ncbi:Eco57I restriction-modification methylase domain-containing protein [Streptosporangium canum]|uniref:Eco57I restriction-modification methylase domain-containing protein n=1 Tax=Streptosporangium canum TaxID=324952 RepID=UPI0033BF55B3
MIAEVAERFLEDVDAHDLPWSRPTNAPSSLITDRVLFGNGEAPLEVAIAFTEAGAPKAEDLRRLWKLRHNNRPSPVLLVVLYGDVGTTKAAACGPAGDPITSLNLDQLGRICIAALAEPDRHTALRNLERLLTAAKDQLTPGLTNQGLFATHELRNGLPRRHDWFAAGAAARPLLGLSGLPLIHALGYDTMSRGSAALLLTHQGTSRSIAVLLEDGEVFDRPSPRFGAVSPISHAIAVAARENLPWVIVLRGSQIRLHPVNPTVGVGRKSQGETFTELDLTLLSEGDAAYLHLLFSPEALAPEGTIVEILNASMNFAADLGIRLRERVYHDMVPKLAVAVARQMGVATEADLQEAYHRTLTILFRLLFVAYAEDRGLLPYGRNAHYDRHAIKTLAKNFAADPGQSFDPSATALWDDMLSVWNAVDGGNSGWQVPAYNGGLFSHDPQTSPAGAALAAMRLTDAELGPVLRALLVDTGPDGTQGPVDFRSLTVREFGTIYEGLLESSLSIAPSPLALDKKGAFVPAKDGDDVIVPAGQVYFHNRSGKRKSTGSYFTKSFAVEHLLNTALEPALIEHLGRVRALLEAGDAAAAAELFFDFRVADLAMGSGHFLVAAIDRIEARFTAFLAEHPIAAVSDELTRLSQAARDALGDHAAKVEIETSALLRRQIARRCVYGLDLNLMAVELARLGIWIHTFVPGLPMSSLDHGLIVGDSLTGIGTIDEVLDVLDPDKTGSGMVSLYEEPIRATLEVARDKLARVARTSEATKQEVQQAAQAYAEALDDAADARALFDAAVAIRLGLVQPLFTPEQAIEAGHTSKVRTKLAELRVTHFPLRFPEVFMRKRPGFDVLLGNPPWEKVKVEEHQWWGLRFPGLRAMSPQEKDVAITRYKTERPDLLVEYQAEVAAAQALKNILASGPFPGLRAATDTEISLAFAWRFWHLLREGGHVGIVLPRTILNGSGGAKLRHTILAGGAFSNVTLLVNNRRWVFDEVHPQYTIGLGSMIKGVMYAGELELRGPFFSLEEFQADAHLTGQIVAVSEFASWSEGAAFPSLPGRGSLEVFLAFRVHPRLDSAKGEWQFMPLRELHSTDNKKLFDFNLANSSGDMPVLTVGSFNLWAPNYGAPYAYAKSSEVVPYLQQKRRRQVRLSVSPFYRMPEEWVRDVETLPCKHPRIVFRDTARALDTRTVIVALVPGGTTMVHSAPYLLRRHGTASDEAYLLGVLSSIVLDWYARRFVEMHMTGGIMAALPVPRPKLDSTLRQRVVEIAARIAAVDDRYEKWATDAGVSVGSVTSAAEKDDLIAELDAIVALLYGFDWKAVTLIFKTFHRGWDCTERLAAVLHHYDAWKSKTT